MEDLTVYPREHTLMNSRFDNFLWLMRTYELDIVATYLLHGSSQRLRFAVTHAIPVVMDKLQNKFPGHASRAKAPHPMYMIMRPSLRPCRRTISRRNYQRLTRELYRWSLVAVHSCCSLRLFVPSWGWITPPEVHQMGGSFIGGKPVHPHAA